MVIKAFLEVQRWRNFVTAARTKLFSCKNKNGCHDLPSDGAEGVVPQLRRMERDLEEMNLGAA